MLPAQTSASSILVLLLGTILLWRLFQELLSFGAGRHIMAQKLLEIFAWLSGGIMIVQVCTLRLCVLLMMPGGRRMGPAHESLSFFMYDDEVEELLHVDLARTPPETERPSPELWSPPGEMVTVGSEDRDYRSGRDHGDIFRDLHRDLHRDGLHSMEHGGRPADNFDLMSVEEPSKLA